MPTVTVPKFNSKTGEGTLSFFARQFGTTVEELAKVNKIENPDLIQEGSSLIVPDSGIQRTTSSFRTQTEESLAKFDERQAAIDITIKGEDEEKLGEEDRLREQKIIDDKAKADGTFDDPFEGLDDDERLIQEEALNQIKTITDSLNSIQRFANDAFRQLISATKQIYAARIQKMKDANLRLIATKGVANIRQGRARFAPELAEDILTDEEISGHERISEIEGTMLREIALASQAKANNDMVRFNAAFDRIEAVTKRMEAQIQQNYDNAVAQDKAIRDKAREARLQAKADFDLSTDRAKTAAPALAKRLAQFDSVDDQVAFLEAYSEQTGVEMDILLGSIETATVEGEKAKLNIRNIESQIINRQRTATTAEKREERLQEEDDDEDEEFTDETKNVIRGITVLADLSGEKREKAKAELRDLGFYEENPPEWFIEMKNAEASATILPEDIKKAWEEYRQGIIEEL